MYTLVPAPALMLVGVALMPIPGTWNLSHLLFLAGTLLMAPAALTLHRLADRGSVLLRRVGLGLTLVGVPALAGQLLIDLVVLELAGGERRGMAPLFRTIQASPAFELPLYTVGPALLFTGLALSGAALLRNRGGWPGGVLIAGTLLMGAARIADVQVAEIAALVLILAAFVGTAATWRGADLRISR